MAREFRSVSAFRESSYFSFLLTSHTYFSYYDNLSAKQCHGKALPCSGNDTSVCVTQELVRLGFFFRTCYKTAKFTEMGCRQTPFTASGNGSTPGGSATRPTLPRTL